ncbi:helix-turn-helix domain-containing protein [Heyndrickxia coagulans]|uniref:helix-turn-helix domain-containing protein n=1 Tax=Heyndrickxia coagulans TaxID=1398 RepID=UPI002E0482A3|nr:helix-turn-helix domain-containing protein [Heyndrickxia coagulans]
MHRPFEGVWIPKEIWLNENLNLVEKVLLAEIDSLDNGDGCLESNGYFAEFLGLSKNRISRLLSNLKKKGFITTEIKYKKGSRQIEERIIKSKKI